MGLKGDPTYARSFLGAVNLGIRVTSNLGLRRTEGFPGTQDFQCSLGKSQADRENLTALLRRGEKMSLFGDYAYSSSREKTAPRQALFRWMRGLPKQGYDLSPRGWLVLNLEVQGQGVPKKHYQFQEGLHYDFHEL